MLLSQKQEQVRLLDQQLLLLTPVLCDSKPRPETKSNPNPKGIVLVYSKPDMKSETKGKPGAPSKDMSTTASVATIGTGRGRGHYASLKQFEGGHADDPVISFTSARKPPPKRNAERFAALTETASLHAGLVSQPVAPSMSIRLPPAQLPVSPPRQASQELIGEEGNVIELEAEEGGTCGCKAKLNKYFCG
jgi:hypothetical protein